MSSAVGEENAFAELDAELQVQPSAKDRRAQLRKKLHDRIHMKRAMSGRHRVAATSNKGDSSGAQDNETEEDALKANLAFLAKKEGVGPQVQSLLDGLNNGKSNPMLDNMKWSDLEQSLKMMSGNKRAAAKIKRITGTGVSTLMKGAAQMSAQGRKGGSNKKKSKKAKREKRKQADAAASASSAPINIESELGLDV